MRSPVKKAEVLARIVARHSAKRNEKSNSDSSPFIWEGGAVIRDGGVDADTSHMNGRNFLL